MLDLQLLIFVLPLFCFCASSSDAAGELIWWTRGPNTFFGSPVLVENDDMFHQSFAMWPSSPVGGNELRQVPIFATPNNFYQSHTSSINPARNGNPEFNSFPSGPYDILQAQPLPADKTQNLLARTVFNTASNGDVMNVTFSETPGTPPTKSFFALGAGTTTTRYTRVVVVHESGGNQFRCFVGTNSGLLCSTACATDFAVAWSTQVTAASWGAVNSIPAVSAKHSRVAATFEGDRVLRVFGFTSNTILWQKQLGALVREGISPFIFDSAAAGASIDFARVIVCDVDVVRGFALRDGAAVWTFQLPGGDRCNANEIVVDTHESLPSPSTAITNHRIFVSTLNHVFCLTATDGIMLWAHAVLNATSVALSSEHVFFFSSGEIAMIALFHRNQGIRAWTVDFNEHGLVQCGYTYFGGVTNYPIACGGYVFQWKPDYERVCGQLSPENYTKNFWPDGGGYTNVQIRGRGTGRYGSRCGFKNLTQMHGAIIADRGNNGRFVYFADDVNQPYTESGDGWQAAYDDCVKWSNCVRWRPPVPLWTATTFGSPDIRFYVKSADYEVFKPLYVKSSLGESLNNSLVLLTFESTVMAFNATGMHAPTATPSLPITPSDALTRTKTNPKTPSPPETETHDPTATNPPTRTRTHRRSRTQSESPSNPVTESSITQLLSASKLDTASSSRSHGRQSASPASESSSPSGSRDGVMSMSKPSATRGTATDTESQSVRPTCDQMMKLVLTLTASDAFDATMETVRGLKSSAAANDGKFTVLLKLVSRSETGTNNQQQQQRQQQQQQRTANGTIVAIPSSSSSGASDVLDPTSTLSAHTVWSNFPQHTDLNVVVSGATAPLISAIRMPSSPTTLKLTFKLDAADLLNTISITASATEEAFECALRGNYSALPDARQLSTAQPLVFARAFHLFTPDAVVAIKSTAVASSVMAALMGTPGAMTGALRQQRSEAVLSAMSCTSPKVGEELDRLTSPLNMHIGDGDLRYTRGAVLGNLILLVAFLAVHGVACAVFDSFSSHGKVARRSRMQGRREKASKKKIVFGSNHRPATSMNDDDDDGGDGDSNSGWLLSAGRSSKATATRRRTIFGARANVNDEDDDEHRQALDGYFSWINLVTPATLATMHFPGISIIPAGILFSGVLQNSGILLRFGFPAGPADVFLALSALLVFSILFAVLIRPLIPHSVFRNTMYQVPTDSALPVQQDNIQYNSSNSTLSKNKARAIDSWAVKARCWLKSLLEHAAEWKQRKKPPPPSQHTNSNMNINSNSKNESTNNNNREDNAVSNNTEIILVSRLLDRYGKLWDSFWVGWPHWSGVFEIAMNFPSAVVTAVHLTPYTPGCYAAQLVMALVVGLTCLLSLARVFVAKWENGFSLISASCLVVSSISSLLIIYRIDDESSPSAVAASDADGSLKITTTLVLSAVAETADLVLAMSIVVKAALDFILIAGDRLLDKKKTQFAFWILGQVPRRNPKRRKVTNMSRAQTMLSDPIL